MSHVRCTSCVFECSQSNLLNDCREPYETFDSNQPSRLLPGITTKLKIDLPRRQDPFTYPDNEKVVEDRGTPLRYASWTEGREKRTAAQVEKPADDGKTMRQVLLATLQSICEIDANDVQMTNFLIEVLNLAKTML